MTTLQAAPRPPASARPPHIWRSRIPPRVRAVVTVVVRSKGGKLQRKQRKEVNAAAAAMVDGVLIALQLFLACAHQGFLPDWSVITYATQKGDSISTSF